MESPARVEILRDAAPQDRDKPELERQLRPMTVITGGSEGIGRELASCFAAGGHDILLIARNQERLRQSAIELAATHDVLVHHSAIDLSDPGAPGQIDAALNGANAYCNVLVNNAGMGLSGAFISHDAASIEQMLQLKVNQLTALMHHFLPGMIKRSQDKNLSKNLSGILNVASLAGFAPGPYQAAYYAGNAYVISLSEAVAFEVAGSGVHISVLAPGAVRTKFHQRMGAENDFYVRFLPTLSAQRAARAGYKGFIWRRRVIVPGIMNSISAVAMRLVPHAISIPIMGLLLRHRTKL